MHPGAFARVGGRYFPLFASGGAGLSRMERAVSGIIPVCCLEWGE